MIGVADHFRTANSLRETKGVSSTFPIGFADREYAASFPPRSGGKLVG